MSNKQFDKFKDAAKELECDESEENFDEVLTSISTVGKKVEKSQPDTNDDFSTPYLDGKPFIPSTSSTSQSHSESNETKPRRR